MQSACELSRSRKLKRRTAQGLDASFFRIPKPFLMAS